MKGKKKKQIAHKFTAKERSSVDFQVPLLVPDDFINGTPSIRLDRMMILAEDQMTSKSRPSRSTERKSSKSSGKAKLGSSLRVRSKQPL